MTKSNKRKDTSGHVLRTGETQRANGSYEFRFTDANKTRHSFYAPTLAQLREKEAEITSLQQSGIDYAAGCMTVLELTERYVALKRGVSINTRTGYNYVLGVLRREAFSQRKILSIHTSDAKLWFIHLYDSGLSFSTISCIRGVLKPAFAMACDEDMVRRNPFCFRLDSIIPNNSRKRVALTAEQEKQFMDFVANDPYYSQYWDEFNILLNTGLRISEFTGLTVSDLDFDKRQIKVDHQLVRTGTNSRYVTKTKTESGRRIIPMSDTVYRSLYHILERRPKPRREVMIDGYVDFLLLDRSDQPKVTMHIEHVVKRVWQKYNETHTIPLPLITPHVFRHTFCTRMAESGMELKNLQYLMGHSDATVTLNVYMHNNYERAAESLSRIVSFSSDPLSSPPDEDPPAVRACP